MPLFEQRSSRKSHDHPPSHGMSRPQFIRNAVITIVAIDQMIDSFARIFDLSPENAQAVAMLLHPPEYDTDGLPQQYMFSPSEIQHLHITILGDSLAFGKQAPGEDPQPAVGLAIEDINQNLPDSNATFTNLAVVNALSTAIPDQINTYINEHGEIIPGGNYFVSMGINDIALKMLKNPDNAEKIYAVLARPYFHPIKLLHLALAVKREIQAYETLYYEGLCKIFSQTHAKVIFGLLAPNLGNVNSLNFVPKEGDIIPKLKFPVHGNLVAEFFLQNISKLVNGASIRAAKRFMQHNPCAFIPIDPFKYIKNQHFVPDDDHPNKEGQTIIEKLLLQAIAVNYGSEIISLRAEIAKQIHQKTRR